MLSRLRDQFLSLIYPQECRVCRRLVKSSDDGVACSECWTETRLLTGGEMLCARCGAYLGEKKAPVPVYCHKCDDHVYDRAIACGIYEKGLSASILHLKETPALSKRVRDIVKERASLAEIECDVVIPIPLAKQRELERGFNQAEMIARVVGDCLGLPVDPHSLGRKLHTPIHRIGMDQKARELTVKNAFEVVRPKLVAGKRALLVDDVLTSGSTASYCAKVLKKAGATSVEVFTLARAVMRS